MFIWGGEYGWESIVEALSKIRHILEKVDPPSTDRLRAGVGYLTYNLSPLSADSINLLIVTMGK